MTAAVKGPVTLWGGPHDGKQVQSETGVFGYEVILISARNLSQPVKGANWVDVYLYNSESSRYEYACERQTKA